MVKTSKLILVVNLTGYGYSLEYLNLAPASQAITLGTPYLLESFVLRFFNLYVTSRGSPLNRYFGFLASRKKTYNFDAEALNILLYNNSAINALKASLGFFFSALATNRRVLFVADQATNREFGFSQLNFLLWPRVFYPALEMLGSLTYYYNSWDRAAFERFPEFSKGFDVVVFCAKDYTRITQATFRRVGRVTVGVCLTHTRPDLFDYPIIANGNYQFTVQWVVALALLNQGAGRRFN